MTSLCKPQESISEGHSIKENCIQLKSINRLPVRKFKQLVMINENYMKILTVNLVQEIYFLMKNH